MDVLRSFDLGVLVRLDEGVANRRQAKSMVLAGYVFDDALINVA